MNALVMLTGEMSYWHLEANHGLFSLFLVKEIIRVKTRVCGVYHRLSEATTAGVSLIRWQ